MYFLWSLCNQLLSESFLDKIFTEDKKKNKIFIGDKKKKIEKKIFTENKKKFIKIQNENNPGSIFDSF